MMTSTMQRVKALSKKISLKATVVAFWLFVWQILYWVIDLPLYLPSPLQSLGSLWQLLPQKLFWLSIALSLSRILLGLTIGCVFGILLSFLAHACSFARELFRPIVVLAKTIPVVSFIMLLWLAFFGREGMMSVFVAIVMVFPIVYSDMMVAHGSVDPKLLEMGKVYSNKRKTLLYIRLPHIFPFMIESITKSVGLAWKAGVATEVICRPKNSIGKAIYDARNQLESAELFAWTAVIVILSLFLEAVLARSLKKIKFRPHISHSEHVKSPGRSFALLVQKISKHFGDKTVLENFSYTFKNGKTTAIVGQSGCGKTTLLKICAGLIDDDERKYRKPDTPISIIFQEDRLIPHLTVEENILFANRSVNIKALLRSVGLSGEENHYPEELSGGMQRRVSIARAIAFKGGIGIFDEPFTGLDDNTKALCAQALFYAFKDKTVLFVTHDPIDAEEFSDEILTLKVIENKDN